MKIMRAAVVVGVMGAVAMMGAPTSALASASAPAASVTTSADSALVATCSKGSYKLKVTVTYVNGLGAHRFRKVFWTASGGPTNVKVSLVQDRGGLPDVAFKSVVITGNTGHKDIPATRPMADRVFVKLAGRQGVTSCVGQSGVI
ncbi:hypothetical protein [Nonomuraea soli]|uniref:Uncharacterized protein n=1 Tax=Nonomuraea soli TaxID=1032476 RepID=A0A7W0CJI7_9ACTN|nr:hypothetical protein [Nonomuraea soli]MBA2892305.1 hypothetical protein [Nonomuraea soli]